jgi:signal transduction histidine kinase
MSVQSGTGPEQRPPSALGQGEAAIPAGRNPFFSKLRVRLLTLVCLAILPALALVLYTALQQRRAAMKEALASALRVVGLAGAEQKRHIDQARQLLETLCQLKEMRPEHAAEAAALFRRLCRTHPLYANIGAIGLDGYPYASAVENTNRIYLGDRPYYRIARESGRFAVGEFQIGRITGVPSVNLAYPVKDATTDQILGVLYVALDLNWLNQLAARAELPDGSTFTVVDRHQSILVRYAVNATSRDYVGQTINRPGLAKFLNGGNEVAAVGYGLDGVKRLYAATPLSRTAGLVDAHVIVGIPVQEANAAPNHTLVQNLIFLGIASVLALGAAWIGSDVFILRQVRGLVGAARRMREGDLAARSGVEHSPGEIGQLAQSFDEMAGTLEQRVIDLQRAEADLKGLNEELEERVVDRTLELKRSNEDLEQFAYVASHDLQEPLRMIHNYLELLRKRYQNQLDQNALEFIGFALDGSKRMHRLIQDLLAYSRVGTRGREMVPTDCGEALDAALANLKLAIDEAGAEIVRGELPQVLGDPVQLSQLFQNLVSNALKFRGDRRARVEVQAVSRPGEWEFSVSDNGIGIAEEDFPRIFIVFQRLHGRDKYPGTGIGLAVCKKIVERHGGRIWVESRPGKGTTFYFTLRAIETTAGKSELP